MKGGNKHLVIDKDGSRHGPFSTLENVRAFVAIMFPGQEQDEDHPGEGQAGKGWDVVAVGGNSQFGSGE
jgi:hypothetical protein